MMEYYYTREEGEHGIYVLPLLFGRASIGVGPAHRQWLDDTW